MKETDPQLSPRYEVVEQLKQARKSLNVTQEDLAERVGTKKSNISRFESGRYNPSLDFLIRIADCLGKQLHIRILIKGECYGTGFTIGERSKTD